MISHSKIDRFKPLHIVSLVLQIISGACTICAGSVVSRPRFWDRRGSHLVTALRRTQCAVVGLRTEVSVDVLRVYPKGELRQTGRVIPTFQTK